MKLSAVSVGLLTVLLLLPFLMQGQQLYTVPDNVHTRWASPENWKAEKGKGGMPNGGRKGSANFRFPAGTEKILAEANGTSGVVRRIWCTVFDRSPQMLRGIRLQMFWDNATKPAVDVPLGDFFGMGLGRMAPFESEFFSSPEGKSFNCNVPMPFRKSMLIKVINESGVDLSMFFYDIDFTIGDTIGRDDLYFHAVFNRQNPTTLRDDYEFLPHIKGKGRFLGVNMGVRANNKDYLDLWWGEGEVKFYLDGDSQFPTLAGTGTEDYIGTGWYLGEYSHRFQGCTIADREKMEFAFYRYHVNDPVYFHQDIRGTIQQIGFSSAADFKRLGMLKGEITDATEKGEAVDFSKERQWLLFERRDDFSSCAYFYLDRPENGLPALMNFKQRVP